MLTSKHTTAPESVFLLASFQMKTHSPRLSPLPLCQAKSPPSAYPSFSFFGRSPASLCASYLSFITEHFRPQNLLQLFFFLRQSPPLIPDSAPPLFKPLSLSHSQSDHAWMRHGCANASSLPICLGAFVCQCESGGKPLLWRPEWYISPEPRLVLGQVKLCGDYSFHLRERKQINHVELKYM